MCGCLPHSALFTKYRSRIYLPHFFVIFVEFQSTGEVTVVIIFAVFDIWILNLEK